METRKEGKEEPAMGRVKVPYEHQPKLGIGSSEGLGVAQCCVSDGSVSEDNCNCHTWLTSQVDCKPVSGNGRPEIAPAVDWERFAERQGY